MIRILSTFALAAALAGPAMAQEARVSVTGKSEQAVRADIHKAAVKVCTESYAFGPHSLYDVDACVAQAEADGMAQAKVVQQSQPSVAALTPADASRR